jgi:hypothetical protein
MVAQAPTAHDVTFHAVPYAGVATRAVALTVDALIVEGGLLVLAAMTSLVAQLVGGVHLGTIAKLIAASAWAPPGVLRSMIRVVALGLCIIPCFLGFLPVLFDDRRRGLHDMAAGTVVRYADGAGAAT